MSSAAAGIGAVWVKLSQMIYMYYLLGKLDNSY